ncbi:radical SAM protein, partial [Bacteroidetes/Chlorobi group bacterium ChocPot_Mid]
MIDFLFFYHPHSSYEVNPTAQFGLGLLKLATWAKQLGSSVRVINAQGIKDKKYLDMIVDCKYLMLYGCLIDAPIINEISKYNRIRKKAKYVFVGGPIGKSPEFLNLNNITALVDGFGEDFVEDLHNGIIREGVIRIPKLKMHIDEYPYPKRELLQGFYGGNIFIKDEFNKGISSTILTSLGCYYHCAFCMSGGETFCQNYSMKRVKEEIEDCVRLGIKHFRISDDNIINKKNRLEELCDILKFYNITWRASIRVKPSSVEMYRLMIESGCVELSFGIESGDQFVLDNLQKGTKVQWNTDAIRNAKKAGIGFVRALMMMGTPFETYDTLELNKQWITEADPDMVCLKIFVPYPGTPIFDNPTKYKCKLLPLTDPNNSAYRPDDSQVTANID